MIHEEMLSLLTSAYNPSPGGNIGKLFRVLADGLDALRGALHTTREWRDLQQACGSTLDRLGGNCGVDRAGMDDPTYRIVIATKMMARISCGDVDTMIRTAAALLGMAEDDVGLVEGDASITLTVDDETVPHAFFPRADALCALLQQAAAAGIAVVLELQQRLDGMMYVGIALQDAEILELSGGDL